MEWEGIAVTDDPSITISHMGSVTWWYQVLKISHFCPGREDNIFFSQEQQK
jgi:hypothetical protein